MRKSSRGASESSNPLPASRDLRIGRLEIRFNWFIALCIVMTCGMFVNLGLWQLDRAAEKRAREQAREQMQSAPAIDYGELVSSTGNGVSHDNLLIRSGQPVRLQGRFLDPRVSFLLMYQFHGGRSGFEVVIPFRPDGRDELVLISRGWMPAPDESGRPEVPPIGPARGSASHGAATNPDAGGGDGPMLEIVARLHVPELPPGRGRVVDEDWPLRVSGLHPGQAAELLGEAVYPQVLRLTDEQPGLLQMHWQEPDFGRRMHYGYAVQWFLFTVLVVLAALLLGSNLLSLLRGKERTGAR